MSSEPDAGDTATDEQKSSSEHIRTVEVPLAEADVERIELEIEQSEATYGAESVEEWIARCVRIEFERIQHRADRHVATTVVDIPPLIARRAKLEAESARQCGKDTSLTSIVTEDEWSVHVNPNTEFGAKVNRIADELGETPGQCVREAIQEFANGERELVGEE